MLTPETTEYCESWMAKLADITGNEPVDHFGRFRILYPVQNRLYGDASANLLAKGTIAKRGGNRIEATDNLVTYLGAKSILHSLRENGNDCDIQHLVAILENNVFISHYQHKEFTSRRRIKNY